jgi:toxin secretion/phage lysis holin
MNKLWNGLFATVGGLISVIAEQYAVLFIIMIIAMVFDVITGILASINDGTGLSSEKSKKGLVKKFAFIFMFGFGIVLDYFFPYVLSLIAIELPFNSPLGMIIATYIVLTESISICENFYRIDKDSFPSWIAKMLSLAKEDINLGNNEDNSQDGE